MRLTCAKCGKKLEDQRRKFCEDCDWKVFVAKLYMKYDEDEFE